MRKLRVVIVAPSLDILGGQAVQADRLIACWQGDSEIDVHLLPINPRPPGLLRAVRRVKYARTIVNELIFLPQLVQHIASADVVHVFSASYSSFFLAPLPAILLSRLLRRPVLMNYHSGAGPDHLRQSVIARWAMAAADAHAVPSTFLRDAFAPFGIDATAIPNIIDSERFCFRPRLPLAPKLLSTRNFEPVYNVACTLHAFRIVQGHRPDASLTLVGGGGEDHRLRALAAELGIRHVRFVGRVPPDEIHRHYAAHDIYLQSPNVDNMPLSVIEAYASGLPVVSTEAGGMPSILTHGVHGLLAPLNDARRLADHVLHLLDDPSLALRLVHGAREQCQAYTWRVLRPQWLRLYRQLAREGIEAPAPAPAA